MNYNDNSTIEGNQGSSPRQSINVGLEPVADGYKRCYPPKRRIQFGNVFKNFVPHGSANAGSIKGGFQRGGSNYLKMSRPGVAINGAHTSGGGLIPGPRNVNVMNVGCSDLSSLYLNEAALRPRNVDTVRSINDVVLVKNYKVNTHGREYFRVRKPSNSVLAAIDINTEAPDKLQSIGNGGGRSSYRYRSKFKARARDNTGRHKC